MCHHVLNRNAKTSATLRQCVFARRKLQWFRAHPLDPSDPLRGSWIVRNENPLFSLGCSICQATKTQNKLAAGIVVQKLQSSACVLDQR